MYVFFCIQSEDGKIRTRKNSVFVQFSRSAHSVDVAMVSFNCEVDIMAGQKLTDVRKVYMLLTVRMKERNGFR